MMPEISDLATNGEATWNNFQTMPLHVVASNESLSNIQSAGEGHWFNDELKCERVTSMLSKEGWEIPSRLIIFSESIS